MLPAAAAAFSSGSLPELRFVGRVYVLRMLGLALGACAVASVLYQNGASPALWTLLAVNAFVWPHVAARLARHSREPRRAELRNLAIDSALGGMWIALMQFNLLPSLALALMLSMDKMSVGGVRLLARTLTWQIAACALTTLACGARFAPETSTLGLLATLPLLLGYPLAVSGAAHALLRQAHALPRLGARGALLGRSRWQQTVADELQRFDRTNQPATLLVIDIDEFGAINEARGHRTGDAVLQAVAATVRENTREIDICGRLGSDEFGVVLINATSAGARVVAERLRACIAALRFAHDPGLSVSASIGIAEADHGMRDVHAWLERADVALSRAKARGRNRVAAVSPMDAMVEALAVAKASCA